MRNNRFIGRKAQSWGVVKPELMTVPNGGEVNQFCGRFGIVIFDLQRVARALIRSCEMERRNEAGPEVGAMRQHTKLCSTGERHDFDELCDAAHLGHIRLHNVEASAVEPRQKRLAARQHFAARNPNYAYIVTYDLPKLKLLQREFPQLWSGK